MQVPQWAGHIPIGQRGRLGPRAMSEGWGKNYIVIAAFLPVLELI